MATPSRGERTATAIVWCLAISLSAAFATWVTNVRPADPCPAACVAAGTEPKQRVADPDDGLYRFGALEAVWNYHHRLVDPTSWGDGLEGYRPAKQPHSSDMVLISLDDSPRVTTVQFYFSTDQDRPTDVRLARGRKLVAPELPADAVAVHPPKAAADAGCVDTDLFRSRLLRVALGRRVLIRVQYDPAEFASKDGPFHMATIEVVPVGNPCVITG